MRRAHGAVLHRPGVLPLLRDQHWVARVSQLEALGVSRASVAAARRDGLVVPVTSGIVALPGAWETFAGRCRAALLVGGDGAFLSGPTAGRLLGMRRMPTEVVECTSHERFRGTVPPFVRLVRTSWRDEEPRSYRADGLVVASAARTLFGLAAQFSRYRFERAAEDAWHLGLIDPSTAADYLARVRRRGRTGVAAFEAWLDRVATARRPAMSGLEQLLAGLAEQAGLPEPERQHRLVLTNGEVVHLDLAWPHATLALEPGHSWWHGGDLGQRADQDRDRACAAMGWQVLRYDESAWERRAAIVTELRDVYARRLARARQRDSEGRIVNGRPLDPGSVR